MATHGNRPTTGGPLIIPLFIPHQGCPHQCVFCNQRAITGQAVNRLDPDQIRNAVRRFLNYGKKRYSTVQVSFFGGSFLGLEKSLILETMNAASGFVENRMVDSLRFSTRPDTICAETLNWISPFAVSTVELGVQSMSDAVLEATRRGHTAADTIAAVDLLKSKGYQVGLQMMVGLPADDASTAMESARRIARLRPDFVRIYPTLVIDGSPLAQRFRAGQYAPLPLAECISLVKRMFLLFKAERIPVVRMGLQASDGLTNAGQLLAGPYHPAFGHLVHGEILLDAVVSALNDIDPVPDRLTITTHPANVSRVQGLNRRNLAHLQATYRLREISIVQDEHLPRHRLRIGDRPVYLP